MNYQDCCMISNNMKVMKTFALRYKMKGSCSCLCSRQWTTNERCYLYFLLNNQSICRWRQHNCCWNLSILLEYVHVKDKSDHYVVPLYSRWSCWEGNDRKLIVVFVMVWYFFFVPVSLTIFFSMDRPQHNSFYSIMYLSFFYMIND